MQWVLRGLERRGDGFDLIPIADVAATQQRTVLEAGTNASYTIAPVADRPVGSSLMLSSDAFAAAAAADQRKGMEALTAVENPLTSTGATAQCALCHVSTVILATRGRQSGIDPWTVAGRYASAFDLSVAAGGAETAQFSLRALGWRGPAPFLSQRVVNETAQVLTEIESRF